VRQRREIILESRHQPSGRSINPRWVSDEVGKTKFNLWKWFLIDDCLLSIPLQRIADHFELWLAAIGMSYFHFTTKELARTYELEEPRRNAETNFVGMRAVLCLTF